VIRRARGNEDRHFGVTDALMLVADIVLIVLWAWGGANVLLGAMLLVLLVFPTGRWNPEGHRGVAECHRPPNRRPQLTRRVVGRRQSGALGDLFGSQGASPST
jgi:hypothetical protein